MYLTYTKAFVLAQNESFFANTSKTTVGVLASAICTDAWNLGAFIHVWNQTECYQPDHGEMLNLRLSSFQKQESENGRNE